MLAKDMLNVSLHVYMFGVKFTPVAILPIHSAKLNVDFEYLHTVLLTRPDSNPAIELDLDFTSSATCLGFLMFLVARYTGDGFGDSNPSSRQVCFEPEGLELAPEGDDF